MTRSVLSALLALTAISARLGAQNPRLIPPPPGANRPRNTPADRQADHLRLGAIGLAFDKGYQPAARVHPHVTEFEVRGPSQAVPFGSGSTEYFQMKRRCSDAQAHSVPHCLRLDAVEIFTNVDSTTQAVTLGVIPHTFVGADESSFLEVGASSDVTGDAEIIARRYGGKVVTAIPWPIPRPTPPSP